MFLIPGTKEATKEAITERIYIYYIGTSETYVYICIHNVYIYIILVN